MVLMFKDLRCDRAIINLVSIILIIVITLGCTGQSYLINKKCDWSVPEASLIVSGARGIRQIVVRSTCANQCCIKPSLIEVNGELFSVSISKDQDTLKLFSLIPLKSDEEHVVNKEPENRSWENKILEVKKLDIRFLNDENEAICTYDSVNLTDSDQLYK